MVGFYTSLLANDCNKGIVCCQDICCIGLASGKSSRLLREIKSIASNEGLFASREWSAGTNPGFPEATCADGRHREVEANCESVHWGRRLSTGYNASIAGASIKTGNKWLMQSGHQPDWHGTACIFLEFEFLVAKIKKLLENENLEQDQRIDTFAACIALAVLSIAPIEKWAEWLPWDRFSHLMKNWVLLLEFRYSLLFDPEASLPHGWQIDCSIYFTHN